MKFKLPVVGNWNMFMRPAQTRSSISYMYVVVQTAGGEKVYFQSVVPFFDEQ